jgi:hypothetical protein
MESGIATAVVAMELDVFLKPGLIGGNLWHVTPRKDGQRRPSGLKVFYSKSGV